jgi:hypothetical protein
VLICPRALPIVKVRWAHGLGSPMAFNTCEVHLEHRHWDGTYDHAPLRNIKSKSQDENVIGM